MSTFITPIEKMVFPTDEEKINKVSPVQTSIPFKDILAESIAQTEELAKITEEDNLKILMGDVDNLAQIQINSMKAESMLQTTVQITTRAVNAYKEVMQMQI